MDGHSGMTQELAKCNRCLYKPWAYGMATIDGHKMLYYECCTCGDFMVVEARELEQEVVAP